MSETILPVSDVSTDPAQGTEPTTGLAARTLALVDRMKGAVAGASLSLATAMSGAGATCATGRCGQGCGYACGIIGVTATGGIAVAAIRRRLGERDSERSVIETSGAAGSALP